MPIGGATNNSLNGLSTVEAYDPLTDIWTTKAHMLTNRCLHAASAVNNKIYVFSGGDVPNVYESVEEYDPILDRWVTKSNIPTPRWGLTSCTIGEKIYTIGGADINNQRLSTLEVYDPVLDLTDVKDHENQSNILKEYNLQQNYPNPATRQQRLDMVYNKNRT